MTFSEKMDKIGNTIFVILVVLCVLFGNDRIIYTSLISTSDSMDKYLILYYPIAYLLTYCMPWLFSKDFKYEKPIFKMVCRLCMVIFFAGIFSCV